MRRLSDSIARLSALRGPAANAASAPTGSLQELRDFGTNPGNLRAWFHMPKGPRKPEALVVVLHGCTQDASGYDHGAGWTQLADELGFAVLYPEQSRSNNFNLCFNWYEPGDSRRGEGEPLSIVQMIESMVASQRLDGSQIYVTGLSAGGAMASVMLATYPEVFAGGAIIAGLPYGSAASVPQALERMRGNGSPDTAALARAVLDASPGMERRPSISIWHGASDHVVSPSNADASLAQWQAVHGLLGAADSSEKMAGHVRRIWRDADGTVMIEDYRIAGMGHGTPLATIGPEACGNAGPHMLEAGISSTRRLADFWGLASSSGQAAKQTADVAAPSMVAGATAKTPVPRAIKPTAKPSVKPSIKLTAARAPRSAAAPPASGVGKIIEDALRAAGLMR